MAIFIDLPSMTEVSHIANRRQAMACRCGRSHKGTIPWTCYFSDAFRSSHGTPWMWVRKLSRSTPRTGRLVRQSLLMTWPERAIRGSSDSMIRRLLKEWYNGRNGR